MCENAHAPLSLSNVKGVLSEPGAGNEDIPGLFSSDVPELARNFGFCSHFPIRAMRLSTVFA
jgi:hypothetical protein